MGPRPHEQHESHPAEPGRTHRTGQLASVTELVVICVPHGSLPQEGRDQASLFAQRRPCPGRQWKARPRAPSAPVGAGLWGPALSSSGHSLPVSTLLNEHRAGC